MTSTITAGPLSSTEFSTIPTTDSSSTLSNSDPPPPVKQCKFSNHPKNGYTCTLSGVSVTADSVEFVIAGQHLAGKNDSDVVSVVLIRSLLEKVPVVIFERFTNLDFLDISNTGISIANENTLKNCGNLKHLDASVNDISSIREGFLSSCKHLENVWVENNLINSISPWNVLITGSKSLKVLSLLDNTCVDESFSDSKFSKIYEQGSSRPLQACFENFLAGDDKIVRLKTKMTSFRGFEEKIRNF